MKPVVYHRLAASELIKSGVFYERRREFLGEAFIAAVEETLIKIRHQPDFGRLEKRGSRSWKVKRFPFRAVYLEQSDRIWVVALAHLSRKPDYWIRRLN